MQIFVAALGPAYAVYNRFSFLLCFASSPQPCLVCVNASRLQCEGISAEVVGMESCGGIPGLETNEIPQLSRWIPAHSHLSRPRRRYSANLTRSINARHFQFNPQAPQTKKHHPIVQCSRLITHYSFIAYNIC